MYAKFRNFPLRINKALGIFRIGVTRARTRTTTVVAIRDAFQRPKQVLGRPMSCVNVVFNASVVLSIEYALPSFSGFVSR